MGNAKGSSCEFLIKRAVQSAKF